MISALLISCSLLLAPAGSQGVRVITYHAFTGQDSKYCFSIDELKTHCIRMQRQGYRFITFDDFRRGNYSGRKNILLTIDGGNRTVWQAYYQVLEPMGIRPLLAVITGIIGKKKYALTWDQLRQLKRDGCSIASHGCHHLFLNRRQWRKNPALIKAEIFRSRKILQEKLGGTVDAFVYPYGERFSTTVRLVRQAGYRYAFTVEPGIVDPARISDPLQVQRYVLLRGNARYFLAALGGDPGTRRVAQAARPPERPAGLIRGGEVKAPVARLPVLKPAPEEIRGVHEESVKIALQWPLEPLLTHRREKVRYYYRAVNLAPSYEGEESPLEQPVTASLAVPHSRESLKGTCASVKTFYLKTIASHAEVYPLFFETFKKRVFEIDKMIREFFKSLFK